MDNFNALLKYLKTHDIDKTDKIINEKLYKIYTEGDYGFGQLECDTVFYNYDINNKIIYLYCCSDRGHACKIQLDFKNDSYYFESAYMTDDDTYAEYLYNWANDSTTDDYYKNITKDEAINIIDNSKIDEFLDELTESAHEICLKYIQNIYVDGYYPDGYTTNSLDRILKDYSKFCKLTYIYNDLAAFNLQEMQDDSDLSDIIEDFYYIINDSSKLQVDLPTDSISDYITDDEGYYKDYCMCIRCTDTKEKILSIEKELNEENKPIFRYVVDITNENQERFNIALEIKSKEHLKSLIQQTIDVLTNFSQFNKYAEDLEKYL